MTRTLRQTVEMLERCGSLRRVAVPLSPDLVIPEIARRAYAQKAPALLFERVEGSAFPAVCNLFGTPERGRRIFGSYWRDAELAVQSKAAPLDLLKNPKDWWRLPRIGLNALPRPALCGAPVLKHSTTLAHLPQLRAWPRDGGAFITLPQVLSQTPGNPSPLAANLGMYRIQISGNCYTEAECGLHYQIHRGIGTHHQQALARGEKLKVSIFVGGPAAHTLAAVMPLPEGMSELMFAGVLAGGAFRYTRWHDWLVSADADFCILGTLEPELKPEGPFGDHVGYYSEQHLFPCLQVEHVFHRAGAIWPFTVVGRPPQEDTTFGELIHELSAPMVPVSLPGVHAMHAVDAAGVHPLLLALGSERYRPYAPREPMELLTQANALLGFGQASLAKYLFIAAAEDAPHLSVYNIPEFFRHMLERLDFSRDLHFHTSTTIDTLDYTGTSLNHGSKLVLAAAGEKKRELGNHLADALGDLHLPAGFSAPKSPLPGVLVIQGPLWENAAEATAQRAQLCAALAVWPAREHWPWVTLCDDSEFAARNESNWLWVTFTRSNPSHDIAGAGERVDNKHWLCSAPLVVDARHKAHHAPALEEDPAVTRFVDSLCVKGGPLSGIIQG
jgi:4-hydroxy-3-polyprenylbenzoate decarboxylase